MQTGLIIMCQSFINVNDNNFNNKKIDSIFISELCSMLAGVFMVWFTPLFSFMASIAHSTLIIGISGFLKNL